MASLSPKSSGEDAKGAVEYTKRRLAAKAMAKVKVKVKNPAAHLRDAISKKYKPESEKGVTRGAGATPTQALDIRAEYLRNQEGEAHAYFKELDDAASG